MSRLAKLFGIFETQPGPVPHPFLRLLTFTAVAAIEPLPPSPPAIGAAPASAADSLMAEEKSETAETPHHQSANNHPPISTQQVPRLAWGGNVPRLNAERSGPT